jgi:hypothetical protein
MMMNIDVFTLRMGYGIACKSDTALIIGIDDGSCGLWESHIIE